jgi:hypothetical protein
MANLGTLGVTVSTLPSLTLNVSYATTIDAVPRTHQFTFRRPVAWWRGYVNTWDLLQYPDNGRFGGLTEASLLTEPNVIVGLIYYPTMTLIGFQKSNAAGQVVFGYQQQAAPLALDRTDAANYALVAFDPTRSFNLVGYDLLTPVA